MRVLLAEDDSIQRELLEELMTFEGYEALTASTPSELLVKLREEPDVVLLDVVGMTSVELRSVLRAMPHRPAVLMVSGDPRLATIAEWLGADGYLAKPYDVEALLGALQQAMRVRAAIDRRTPDGCLAEALLGA